MRKLFAELLFKEMSENNDVFLTTADLGFGILDSIRDTYPDRAYNVGAAEFLMIGVGIGLADAGKIPVCYSISSFLLYRPFELLRNYLHYESIPVKLVGSGRDKEYSHDGISHWSHDDELILSALPKIKIYKPYTNADLVNQFQEFLYNGKPSYLNLSRFDNVQ